MMVEVSRVVDPRDHMFNSGPDWYWSVGESGLAAVSSVLSLAHNPPVRRILDLPCGHGRVGRHLKAAFPEADIVYCDLDAQGAEFCAREFGGTALVSRPELSELQLAGKFDVIWIGSLFTHLDRDRTERWLRYLCEYLSETGVLAATFHGSWTVEVHSKGPITDNESWAKIVAQYEATGYGYARYPFMNEDYGISLSRPSVIIEMAEKIAGVRLLSYTERGWADNHDVLGIGGQDRMKPW
ncbi:MAG TPA: class I SAM-dependent methyltransferase [Pyrinomonadaceae bacterium]|nr:class I SAM-dependent methyltransferase [Pyrinomonadaceae bacterium]